MWKLKTFGTFWLLGLFNNAGYVIMNAGAKDITPCLVGLVYVANVIPSLSIKATLPFWQHRVSYSTRLRVATALMFTSFIVVVLGQVLHSPGLQLFGVACGAAQSGLGEASLLAMASLYGSKSRLALTAWSSGTGFAGIFGYAFVILFTAGFGASFTITLLFGLCVPLGYGLVFFKLREAASDQAASSIPGGEGFHSLVEETHEIAMMNVQILAGDGEDDKTERNIHTSLPASPASPSLSTSTSTSTTSTSTSQHHPSKLPQGRKEIASAVIALWPYTVPLFIVYFAEYAMQSGTWAAIGFPVTDATARKEFYQAGNFAYQIGVFISRSSGNIIRCSKRSLWIMPTLQVFLLLFFWTDAAFFYWYDWTLLFPCFVTGCLGGAVYVGVFTLINVEIPKGPLREFSLSAASVADSIGIVCSDLFGMIIQSQLYAMHNLSGGTECGEVVVVTNVTNMMNTTNMTEIVYYT
jgi:battenin